METLKNINTNSNDVLYHENLKYLNNLKKSIKHINNKLTNISINDIFLNEISTYMYLDFKLCDFNNILNITLIDFLLLTIDNIKKLKNDIPNYINISNKKNICDEYHIFHNNIIKNITTFIHYYDSYFNRLYEMYKYLTPFVHTITTELEEIIIKYDTMCKNGIMDINILNNAKYKKKELHTITQYNNYIVKQINYYISIKKEFKNINVDFLNNLNNKAYN